ncbi:hypothetical protein BDF14DRAFT_1857767 [Spinellus fusiger]|nr:hypothetical protein BDF14DRAFT_1857767 [Spinellus fusiger]
MVSYVFILSLLLAVLVQITHASVFSQLQFIKIESPYAGQDIKAGQPLVIKYVMQPLVFEGTSMGKALSLDINFHARTGNQKTQQLGIIHKSCPVAAQDDKYVTYTKQWVVPVGTAPGSYAVDFNELVQFRRSQVTATETVNVNVVD